MTIRRRLLLLLLPALAILMVAGALADRWIAAVATEDAYDQALASAAIAAAAYAGAGNPVLPIGLEQGRHGELRFFAVTGPDGQLLAGIHGLPSVPIPARAAEPTFADASFHGRRVREVGLWVPTVRGPLRITAAETGERREQTQRVMLLGKLLVDFAELDVLMLLIWVAVSLGLRPLARLRDDAEAQSPHALRRFDQQQVPGELRGLVVAFNRVLELLHDAVSAQRRFVADAAHQMRTPVAGLLAQIQLLKAEAHADPVAGRIATLERAAQSVAHAANQLLALARAEPAAAPHASFQPVALDALVRDLVERHLERADQAGIDLGAETQPISVAGSAWLLEDLLGNLLDNALKYTPCGGHVTVRTGVAGGLPYLQVDDDGPGIPEPERQRVRERFYRRPGSASVGVGLGLAIVDEIARAHQANFSIGGNPQGRGTRMRVCFRAAVSRATVESRGDTVSATVKPVTV